MSVSDEVWAAFSAIRSRSDILVLMALRDGEPRTQSIIAEVAGLNQSTVSRCLRSLREAGYIVQGGGGHHLAGTWLAAVQQLQSEVDAHEGRLAVFMGGLAATRNPTAEGKIAGPEGEAEAHAILEASS